MESSANQRQAIGALPRNLGYEFFKTYAMGDIRISIEQLQEPAKSIGKILIEFYQTMKGLETDMHRGGKQATKIVMTISDIEGLLSAGVVENFAHEPTKDADTEALNGKRMSSKK